MSFGVGIFETLTIGEAKLTGPCTAALAVSPVPGKARRCREEYVVNPLKSSRGTKLLAAGAAVAAIGLGGGGWAYAASSGGAPALTPAGRAPVVKVAPARPVLIRVHPAGTGRTDGCSGLYLTPVPGVPAPPVQGTENPAPVPGQPVVCDGGTTAG
jgi:hypothetical protein